MKKGLVAFGLFAVLFSLMIAACNNGLSVGMNPAVVQQEEEVYTADTLVFKLSNTVSRTLLPDDWDADTKGALVYELIIKSVANSSETLVKTLYPTYAQLTAEGGYKITGLDPVVYSFYLNAYQKASDYDDPSAPSTDEEIAAALSSKAYKALQASRTNVDTSTGNNTITFDLATVTTGNDGANGLADITVAFKATDDFGKVVYGFFNAADPASAFSVTSGETSTTYTKTETDTEVADYTGGLKKVVWNENVPAMQDKYFGAIFYNKKDIAVGAYFDRITVDAGNETHGEINVGDILNTYAKNPTEITVTYSYLDDNDCKLTDADDVSTMVDATFTWTRACLNELGYLLCIYDLGTATDGIPTTQPATPTYAFNAKNTVASDSADSRAAVGSLLEADLGPGGTSAKVRLQTGHIYTASVRAYNWTEKGSADDAAAIGAENAAVLADGPNADNAYEHPTFIGHTVDTTKTAAEDLAAMWTAKSEQKFGMYTITYNLNKGYVVTQSGNTVKAVLQSNASTGLIEIVNVEDVAATETTPAYDAYEQYFVRAYNYGTAATIMSDYNHEGYSIPYAKHDSYAFSKWVLPSTLKDATANADATYTADTDAVTGAAEDVAAKAFPDATTISNFEYKAVWSVVVTVNDITFPSYGVVPEVLIEGRSEGETITVTVGDEVYIKALTITDATEAATAETVTLTGYDQNGVAALSAETVPALAPTTNGSLTWDTTGVAPGTYQIRATCSFTFTTNNGTDKTVELQQTVYVKINSHD